MEDKSGERFISFQEWMTELQGLLLSDKLIYAHIYGYKGHCCRESAREIAKWIGCPANHVYCHLSKLIDLGYIAKNKGMYTAVSKEEALKITPKTGQSTPKTGQKNSQNGSNLLPKWDKNSPKTGQKNSQNGSTYNTNTEHSDSISIMVDTAASAAAEGGAERQAAVGGEGEGEGGLLVNTEPASEEYIAMKRKELAIKYGLCDEH